MSRVTPPSAIGSLFKQAARLHKPRAKRHVERDYLADIRALPCLSCDVDPAGEAAHVRMAATWLGKPVTGTGIKPDDRWAVPLCHICHMRQHTFGEASFWRGLGLDPLLISMALYKSRGDLQIMRNIVFTQKEIRK